MPLEVREIGIRVAVVDSGADGASGDHPREKLLTDEERALIVEECVEAVLAALNSRREV